METLSLPTASSAALREIDSTTHLINDVLGDHVTVITPALSRTSTTSKAQAAESVLAELYELGRLLEEQHQDSSWNDDDNHHRLLHHHYNDHEKQQLRSSVAWVIRSSADVCTQIRQVLIQSHTAGDGSELTNHSSIKQVQQLRKMLESIRRTATLVLGALEDVESSPHLLEEIEHLRQDIAPADSEIAELLIGCLDEVERYSETERVTSFLAEPSPPGTPSIHEMVKSLRDLNASSFNMSASREQATARSTEPTHQRSTPQAPTLLTIQDEDYHAKKGSVKRETLSAPLPTPLYTLLPPASPPPNKALPPVPVPPAKSPRRANRLSTASSAAPEIPKKSRARAFSDMTHDSKFSSVSSAATRSSVASQCSSSCVRIPPRSSSYNHHGPVVVSELDTIVSQDSFDHQPIALVPVKRLDLAGKDGIEGPVYALETLPDSTILASRHDKFHIKITDSSTGEQLATLKVPFYVQMQIRSRDFFIRSHHVISETLGLVAIATNFGQTIEIWNWIKHKKVQTINDAYRWAAVRDTVFETRCFPMAAYRSDDDVINLYPVSEDHAKSKKKNPPFFGKPRAIELRKAGLPHVPKLPELAYSATAPLLVAAAGPRPPRPGNPPPEHAALLMAWQLEDGAKEGHAQQNTPYRFLHYRGLENSLPLSLATYGSVAVSIWEPARFRTIGRPDTWQVEPVMVTEKIVLVWDFGSSAETATTFSIPDVLSCVSPDCRFVAYCDSGTRKAQQQSHQLQQQYEAARGDGSLVVVDAMSGRELWRVDGLGGPRLKSADNSSSVRNSTWSGRSSETKSSSNSSRSSHRNVLFTTTVSGGGKGSEMLDLAGSLDKVTDLAFSGDGNRLFVGYRDGGVGVFEVQEGIGLAV